MISANPTVFSASVPADEKSLAARTFAICDSVVKHTRSTVFSMEELYPAGTVVPSIADPGFAAYLELKEKVYKLKSYIEQCRKVIEGAIRQGQIVGADKNSPDGSLSSYLMTSVCAVGQCRDIARLVQIRLPQKGITNFSYVALACKEDPRSNHMTIIQGKFSHLGIGQSDCVPLEKVLPLFGNAIVVDPFIFESACRINPLPDAFRASITDSKLNIVMGMAEANATPEEAAVYEKNMAAQGEVFKPIILQFHRETILRELAAATGLEWKAPSKFTSKNCFLWTEVGDLEKARTMLLAKGIPENQVMLSSNKSTGKKTLAVAPLGIGLLALVVGVVPKASLKKDEEKKQAISIAAAPKPAYVAAPAKKF